MLCQFLGSGAFLQPFAIQVWHLGPLLLLPIKGQEPPDRITRRDSTNEEVAGALGGSDHTVLDQGKPSAIFVLKLWPLREIQASFPVTQDIDNDAVVRVFPDLRIVVQSTSDPHPLVVVQHYASTELDAYFRVLPYVQLYGVVSPLDLVTVLSVFVADEARFCIAHHHLAPTGSTSTYIVRDS